MRMRRKKNLEARLEACGDYILYLDRDEKNFQDKSNKQLIDFGHRSIAPVRLEYPASFYGNLSVVQFR